MKIFNLFNIGCVFVLLITSGSLQAKDVVTDKSSNNLC